ncbi:major facilitator superfamily domain-containing protein 6-like protein B [Ixodes scapularis]|uniref:major facilitator superfamily domain-containing protein 6-like protein B n=1 Tax=Ixodes scapularis TaxID=6945 RepID=UPI001A9D7DF8|nr:major facilitator superfamily domain-containing protein 6-like protein B [Ixodes scapularis]
MTFPVVLKSSVGTHIYVRVYYTSVGRRIGISEEAIAYIFGILPIVVILVKFVIAYIVDKTERASAMLIVLQATLLVSNGVTFFSHCFQNKVKQTNVLKSWKETPSDKSRCELSCMNKVVAVNAFSLWLYVVFVVTATAVSMATMVVTDSATCEVLAEKGSFVGKLRLWAFISIGMSSLLIGALIGVDNSGIENNVGFTPCFYVVAVFALLDILFLFRAPRLKMSNRSTSFFKDTWTVLKSIDMMVFSLFSCFIGAFGAFHVSYNVWFLEDIGSSQLTIGLASAVQNLAVQAPLLFVSGHIFKGLGYFLTCSLIFLAFALKFVGFSLIYNPWYAVVVDVTYGAAHSLMTGAMPAFAQDRAPGGTVTTLLSVLIACTEGIGVLLGNLVGGLGFGKFGGRLMFRYVGIAAATCMLLSALFAATQLKKSCTFSPNREAKKGEGQPGTLRP